MTAAPPNTSLVVAPGPNAMMLRPASLDDAIKLSEKLAGNPTLPQEFQKANSILLIILKAADLKLSVAQAFEGLHVIKGRVVMSSAMATGLVIRDPLCEYFECVSETDEEVIYETKRVGGKKPIRGSFTVAQAKAAGLWKPDSNWQKFTSDMLHARARARCARRAYPDLLLGMPPMREDVEDGVIELTENGGKWEAPPPPVGKSAPTSSARGPSGTPPTVSSAGTDGNRGTEPKPVVETTATPVDQEPSQILADMVEAILKRLEAVKTPADLSAILPDITSLPPAERAQLRGPYRAAQELLLRMAAAPKTWGDDVPAEREPGSDDE